METETGRNSEKNDIEVIGKRSLESNIFQRPLIYFIKYDFKVQ